MEKKKCLELIEKVYNRLDFDKIIDSLSKIKGSVLIVTSNSHICFANTYAKVLNIVNDCVVDVCLQEQLNSKQLQVYRHIFIVEETNNIDSSFVSSKQQLTTLRDFYDIKFENFNTKEVEYLFVLNTIIALVYYTKDIVSSRQLITNFVVGAKEIVFDKDSINVFVSDANFDTAFNFLNYVLGKFESIKLKNINKIELISNSSIIVILGDKYIFIKGFDEKLDNICLSFIDTFQVQMIDNTTKDALLESLLYNMLAVLSYRENN